MDEKYVVPALAPAEAEEFWGGSDALADPGAVPGTQAAARAGRSFEIVPGPEDCWLLYLYEDGREAGAGQFPEDCYCDALEAGEEFCAAADPQPETLEPVETEAGAGPIPVWYRKESGYACCVGIDMPEVGHVHAADCPAMRWNHPCGTDIEIPPVRSGREDAGFPIEQKALAGELGAEPQPPGNLASAPAVIGKEVRELIAEIDAAIMRSNEKRDRTERLLTQLLFAARDVADRNILCGSLAPANTAPAAVCTECHMVEHLGKLTHAGTCCTGRVLGILEALTDVEVNSDGKETGEKVGRAADGILPRGFKVCMKCGSHSGEWDAETVPENYARVEMLGLNQLMTHGPNGNWNILTHRCESKLRGVDVLFGMAKGGVQ